MSTRPSHRTLKAEIAEWDERRIAALLQRRPDLAARSPKDRAELALHAQEHRSRTAAVGATTLAESRLLQLVVCCPPDVTLTDLVAALPDDVTLTDLEPVLRSLEVAALVWRHDGRLHSSGMLTEVVPTVFGPPLRRLAGDQTVAYLHPVSRLVRAAVEAAGRPDLLPLRSTPAPKKADLIDELERLLSAAAVVDAVLAAAPPASAEVARRMAAGSPRVEWYSGYWTPGRATERDPRTWLLDHALLWPEPHTGRAAQPREVAVAMRGGRPVDDLAIVRPALGARPVEQAAVDGSGGQRARMILDRIAELLDRWREEPAKTLQSGGLGVSATKKVAALFDVAEAEAALTIELAHVAGLLAARVESFRHGRT
ncbi:MAG: hypothetical protein IT196_10455, partial [Acidimicrobiales bacterium]|nr:hypothetical protein [Acidimicrobiales bacterium]